MIILPKFSLRISIPGWVDLLPQNTGQLCIKYEQSGKNGVTLSVEYQYPGDTAYYWDIYL